MRGSGSTDMCCSSRAGTARRRPRWGRTSTRSSGCQVVTVSRPGYGATDVGRPDGRPVRPRVVATSPAALGIARFDAVVGVSFGGLQALHTAVGTDLAAAPRPAQLRARRRSAFPDTRRDRAMAGVVFHPAGRAGHLGRDEGDGADRPRAAADDGRAVHAADDAVVRPLVRRRAGPGAGDPAVDGFGHGASSSTSARAVRPAPPSASGCSARSRCRPWSPRRRTDGEQPSRTPSTSLRPSRGARWSRPAPPATSRGSGRPGASCSRACGTSSAALTAALTAGRATRPCGPGACRAPTSRCRRCGPRTARWP